jgi:hypothetical protein
MGFSGSNERTVIFSFLKDTEVRYSSAGSDVGCSLAESRDFLPHLLDQSILILGIVILKLTNSDVSQNLLLPEIPFCCNW